MSSKSIIGVTLGDANGIGPEVVVEAVGRYQKEGGRALMIGEAWVAQRALDLLGSHQPLHVVDSATDVPLTDGGLYILHAGSLTPRDLVPAQPTAEAGRSTVSAFHTACNLARSREIDGVIFGPVNSESIHLAGLTLMPTDLSRNYQLLITGPLRVAHLSHHVSLRDVLDTFVKKEKILELLRIANRSLQEWGLPNPQIAVAGLNPHCVGIEDKEEVAPAVAQALKEGINVHGPVAPDSVFRQCIEGQYDLVIAHYHDQGHIAVKTWGFSGNCAVLLGVPFLVATVAHGSAYEIAWRGEADPSMMLSSLHTCGQLAQGRGFPKYVVDGASITPRFAGDSSVIKRR